MNKHLPILVTGGASGLGLAIVQALTSAGYEAHSFDIKDGCDVTKQLPSWVSKHEWGGLINCAGINHNEWFEDVTQDSLERLMDVNAFSMIHMTQALLKPLSRQKGFVLNIVSNAASMPMTSSLAYNMSKAAALMATKQMAHELTKSHGITVFSISPNKLAGTEMSRQIEDNVIKTRGWSREFAAEYQKKSLMHGRETDPVAIAEFIVHLVETGSWEFMSGTDIPFGK